MADSAEIENIRAAVLAGDTADEDFAALPVPASYHGMTVRRDEADMFTGLESQRQGPAQEPAPRRGGHARARLPARRWWP